jgi:ABC-2 type transport system ATP-binding protein
MALIALEDVHVSYGDREALRGATFKIEGGAVGLLGPNGAGKSTILKTVLGFIRPTSGTVAMWGKKMPEHALEVRQRLGYMPERDIVSPKVSAVSFLTYCGCLFGMSRVDAMERAHEVLNYVGFGENRYRKMETYSTGMCQRVKFAQALVHDPKLLLLDEPTNGLDPEGRVEMLELIRELAYRRKVTIVLSTHLLPDVEHVCDRVIMISKGRVVVDGAIDAMMTPRDGLFELRVRDNKEAFLAAVERAGCTWQDQHTGNLLIIKPPELDARALFELARAQNTQIRHFRPVRQRLEEVFMQAVTEASSE